jgi:hypothetical protein
VAQLRRLQALANARLAPVAQLAGGPEEEVLVQGKFATAELQSQLQQAPRANNTGLPDQLKSGIESLSGLSLDDVRVHYNSAQPAQLNALAYAQGSDIHLAPGQEQHLPHEAWHVVQQAQGRVRPTLQRKDGVPVNDDPGLEREADVMGSKALEGRYRVVDGHHSISVPIETAQSIDRDATNSLGVIVANNDSAPLANGRGSAQRGGNEMQRIADHRPEAALQRQVQAWGDGSDRVEELRTWQGVADGRGVGGKSQDLTPGFTAQRQAQERGGHLSTQLASSPRQLAQRRLIGQMLGSAVQRVEGELDEEEGGAAQLRSEPVQRVEVGLDEEEEPAAAAQLRADPAQLEENRTGITDGVKAGIESLSGMDMSGVCVHRNSSQPVQLNALAYAQGNDIHLGPGQEQHLPHEAWHVVQQRQGRVQATMQMAGVGVNDDHGLEREAEMRTEGDKRQDLTPNLSAPSTSQPRRTQQPSPASTAIAHSLRMTAQRQAIRAALGANAAPAQLRPGQGSVNATTQRAGTGVTAVQLTAVDGLREIKQYYDKIQRRIPGAWQALLQVLDDVTARNGDARTWRNNKAQAEDLWQTWQVAYTRAETGQPIAYPGPLTKAREQMLGYFQAFDAVHALLFENGIADVKQQLAEQHYLAVPSFPPFDRPFYTAAPDESLDQLKARIRVNVMDYVRPGQNVWLAAAGYGADPYVRQLAKIATYDCHWTMYRANLWDLANLRVEDGAGNVNTAQIDDRLIPSGVGSQGAHVSLEVADVGDNKPRIFGRPANLARTYNNASRPAAVTWADMATALNNANANKSTQIRNWATDRNARIRANWVTH